MNLHIGIPEDIVRLWHNLCEMEILYFIHEVQLQVHKRILHFLQEISRLQWRGSEGSWQVELVQALVD